MVTVYKDVCMPFGSPYTTRSVHFQCDLCETRCDPHGSMADRLYEYDGEQLCLNCLLENLENAGIIRQITE